MSSPPAGWYADPDDPAGQRYWDGSSWTESRAPAGAAPTATPAHVPPPVRPETPRPVASWPNVYETAVDLDQVLTPEQRAWFGSHTLTRFPTWLVVVLHFLTFGIFTLVYQGLKLSKLPRVREDDFGAGKGIGFNFIPLYSLYWVFRFVNALNDRLNFQLRLRGERPRCPRGLGIACCILWVIPFYTALVTFLVLMPLMAGYMQAATNRLVDLREREA